MNELAAPQKHIDFGATGQREFSFLCSRTTVPYVQLFKITELYDDGKLTLKSVWRSKRYRVANRRFKDKGRAEHCANFKAKYEAPVGKTG